MALKEIINTQITAAMKAKDPDTLRGLREIKAQLLLLETDDKRTVNEESELKILQKMAKQRQDSIAIFTEQGRIDLAEKEEKELTVISTFLPAQLTVAELTLIIKEVIVESGAKSMADMGKIMPSIMSKTAGSADGKTISAIIKEIFA